MNVPTKGGQNWRNHEFAFVIPRDSSCTYESSRTLIVVADSRCESGKYEAFGSWAQMKNGAPFHRRPVGLAIALLHGNSQEPAAAAIDLLTRILISTRRFSERPSRVSLVATGRESP